MSKWLSKHSYDASVSAPFELGRLLHGEHADEDRLILDGARPLFIAPALAQTFLRYNGAREEQMCLWSLDEPEICEQAYSLYRACGADIALTNTFDANKHALSSLHIDTSLLIQKAVAQARSGAFPFVLGGMQYICGAQDALRQQASMLLGLCDGLYIMLDFDSLESCTKLLAEIISDAPELEKPLVVSFSCGDTVCFEQLAATRLPFDAYMFTSDCEHLHSLQNEACKLAEAVGVTLSLSATDTAADFSCALKKSILDSRAPFSLVGFEEHVGLSQMACVRDIFA